MWPVQIGSVCAKCFSTGFASGPSGINFLLPWVVLLMVLSLRRYQATSTCWIKSSMIKTILLPNLGFWSTSWDPLVLDEEYLRFVVLSDSLCFKMCLHLSCWNQNAIRRYTPCHLSITLHVRNTPPISDRCAWTMFWSHYPYCVTYHDLIPD